MKMNRHTWSLVRGLALAAASFAAFATAHAQYVPSTPARPFPGYINEHYRGSDPYMNAWDIGINARERLEVKFPRPRSRRQLLEDPEYYRLREELIGFLEERSHHRPARSAAAPPAKRPPAAPGGPGPGINRFLRALSPAS